MERKAKGKGYKKVGAPFMGMFGGGGGGAGMLMNKKLHAKAHERMGIGKEDNKEEETKEVDQIALQDAEASKPGKAPVNKKDE